MVEGVNLEKENGGGGRPGGNIMGVSLEKENGGGCKPGEIE